MLKIAVICGGPSAERGISINTARSTLDHLNGDGIEIVPFYVDRDLQFHSIPAAQLYSNTPSDFDFKLKDKGRLLDADERIRQLKACDLVFPCIHGAFGEDGGLQTILEKADIPFVGSSESTCRKMFNKDIARQTMQEAGYHVLPMLCIDAGDAGAADKVTEFFREYGIADAIVKPAASGSSIGVKRVSNATEAANWAQRLIDGKGVKQKFNRVIVERFLTGREFSVVILQNRAGDPVALPPTNIEWTPESVAKRETIYTYGKKYMPKDELLLHCPADFPDAVVARIRKQAEDLFKLFEMRDMARLDGWLLDGEQLAFTDFNPISGMEQNSYFFVQASRIGFKHRDLMLHIVEGACRRNNIAMPQISSTSSERQSVRVLFGGNTAERQVSLMSGTNVWLKLIRSQIYEPTPYLLDKHGDVWELPYAFCINHTVEEIALNCEGAAKSAARCKALMVEVRERLLGDHSNPIWPLPRLMSLSQFFTEAQSQAAFVFLGLHGGDGENGTIQGQLDSYGIAYNGSGPEASNLCMDKLKTGKWIDAMHNPSIVSAAKDFVTLDETRRFTQVDFDARWQRLTARFKVNKLLIKPRYDGCSAGIVPLCDAVDLKTYFDLLRDGEKKARVVELNDNVLVGDKAERRGRTELHRDRPDRRDSDKLVDMEIAGQAGFLIEPFIDRDTLKVEKNELIFEPRKGWLELTVGVLEEGGVYHALTPSITVAEDDVLTMEEKFQGGTGVNITPPPPDRVSHEQVTIIRNGVEQTARRLGIQNYARIDVFFNARENTLMIIEANSLPGLTPSTVIYHQALAEPEPLPPRAFLERLIQAKRRVA